MKHHTNYEEHRRALEAASPKVRDYTGIERGELIEEIYRKDAEIDRLRRDLEIWRRNGGDVLLRAQNAELLLTLKQLTNAATSFEADPVPDDGGQALANAIDNARAAIAKAEDQR